jgi:hypothetical protein
VETGGDNEATDTITARWTGVTFTTTVAGEPVPGMAAGTDYTVGLFVEDAPCYVDRNHQWNGITPEIPLPAYLVGGEYIMIGNDNRDNPDLRLDVTVSEPVVVYLLIDNRLFDSNAANPPDHPYPPVEWEFMRWVGEEGYDPVFNGLNRTADAAWPDEVAIDGGGDGVGPGVSVVDYASVYSKQVGAGTFTLGALNDTVAPTSRNIYGVVVQRLPNSVNNPPVVTNLNPANNTLFHPGTSLSFSATTIAPNSISASGIRLVLNGVDLSADLTLGGTGANRQVTYPGLVPNTYYTAHLVVADQANRAVTNDFAFDTFVAAGAIMVEAEDYNYDGGQFNASPTPGSYAGRLGTREIDFHNNNGAVPTADPTYRAGDYVPVGTSTDVARSIFAGTGATDYLVTGLLAGDWLNYTRALDGAYNAYLRGSTSVAQDVRADLVGNPTAPDQQSLPAGVFQFAADGGLTPFTYAPLLDAAGNQIVLSTTGNTTFRLTPLSANANLQLNYILLVPTTQPPSPAFISSVSPTPGAVGVTPDALIRITLLNSATDVDQGSMVLRFNETDVTSTATVLATDEGVLISYDPPGLLPLGAEQSVQLNFTDSAGAPSELSWSFTTTPSMVTIPANFGTAPGTGQNPGLNVKMRKAPNFNAVATAFTLANTTARAEQQLADQLIDPDTQSPYLNEADGPAGTGLTTDTVINYDQLGAPTGFFGSDVPFPFVDLGFTPDPNNMAMEITAYLELAAGFHRFGVRSDDGFRLTCGPTFAADTLQLGLYEGGRGNGLPAGATEFDVYVESAGVYPIRLIWYEGNGGASLEFYSVHRETFTRTLINDSTAPALQAYRSRSAEIHLPVVTLTSPVTGTTFPMHPTDVTLAATASVVNGTIQRVEFFDAAAGKIGEASSSPYTAVWANVPAGRYRLTARATDANSLTSVSAPVDIRVGAPLIANVVEIGGDNELTDTVPATWTDQTFSNGIVGEFLDPYTVPPFGEDVPAYVDRIHHWNGATTTLPIPPYLAGAEYIMSGNDNRDNIPYQLDITLSESAYVYLLVDDRLGDTSNENPPNHPDWTIDANSDGLPDMGWVVTDDWQPVINGLNRFSNPAWPDQVGVDEGGDGVGPGVGINQWASIYVKQLPAGTFSIYEADNPGRNMYGVVVSRVGPTVVTEPPQISPPSISSGNLTITWTGGGTLQSTGSLTPPITWTDVGTGGSVTEPLGADDKFYRVRKSP